MSLFAESAGYVGRSLSGTNAAVQLVCCYKDMTGRDLIEKRSTDRHGNTEWRLSGVVQAALDGALVVLDGVNRLTTDSLSVLASLIRDRELHLPDGRRLLRHDRYDALAKITGSCLTEKGILRIHPKFRLAALSLPPDREHPITSEFISLFTYIEELKPLSVNEKISIIAGHANRTAFESTVASAIQNYYVQLEQLTSDDRSSSIGGFSFHFRPSLRQLDRLWRSVISAQQFIDSKDELHEMIKSKFKKMFLVNFMPEAMRTSINSSFEAAAAVDTSDGLQWNGNESVGKPDNMLPKADLVMIGRVTLPIYATNRSELVPNTHFITIPAHARYLEDMAKDVLADERHILLIGNQGTGKNKLTDRLCHLMNWPREYMQLHRDTTVQSLTTTPTLINGVVAYEDSPLIKAIKLGHALVLDEADKAPTEVVVVLKGLIEDGLLSLDDGRRILSPPRNGVVGKYDSNDIYIHKNFRLFVLANRPGFPFLGNDFFREAGDCFSSHIIENPDAISQLQMLKAFAKTGKADDTSIHKLIGAFDELRDLYEEGVLTYPYSVRELVNVVKHMDKYPQDGIPRALDNVLSWDGLGTGNKILERTFSSADESVESLLDTPSVIRTVLLRHGINADDLRTQDGLPASAVRVVTPFELIPCGSELFQNDIYWKSLPATMHKLFLRNSTFKFGSMREVSGEKIAMTQDMVGTAEQLRYKIGAFLSF